MMTIKQILVPLTCDADVHALDAAASLAHRFEAAVEALLVHPDPRLVLGSLGGEWFTSYAAVIEQSERHAAETTARRQALFEGWQSRQAGAPSPVMATLYRETGFETEVVARLARLADLVVMTGPSGGDLSALGPLEGALFDGGAPVLMLPGTECADLLSSIVIAWNDSRESALAVRAALPLLSKAGRVSVFYAAEGSRPDVDRAALIAMLARHGIVAEPILPAPVATGGTIGEALLREARIVSASLIVMGAYTHSRLRQLVFGGVTAHMIDKATIPVLMAR
jgi:nucleotide-binding universal stress UspA family protein